VYVKKNIYIASLLVKFHSVAIHADTVLASCVPMNVSVVSRISSAVIDNQRCSISRVTSEKKNSRKDAESDDHDSAQVLYGGCARAQPREAQISLRSKYVRVYVCVCVCARARTISRQPRGCNGTMSSLVDLARSMPPWERSCEIASLVYGDLCYWIVQRASRVVNKRSLFHFETINFSLIYDRFIFDLLIKDDNEWG